MKYQCNNTFYKGQFNYNLGEIITEQEFERLPNTHKKWFTLVGKPLHFYCQNLCGDVDFSIDEWNSAYDEVKNMSGDVQRLVLSQPPPCKEQCFSCMAIVGATRLKTQKLQ